MPITQISKAIAAFLTPVITVPLGFYGITESTPFGQVVEIVLVTVLTSIGSAAAVYFAKNK
jgi:hypothetical protein